MRIAHLILAHKSPGQILRQIRAMQHSSADFFIHIDRKVDIRPFKALINSGNVYFVEKRARVYWGGWGTIQATLNGFEMILTKKYDYVNVLSGQDFPIKSASYINSFFQENQGLEFITCDPLGDTWDVASRVENYHLINWRIPGKFRLSKLLTLILPKRVFPMPFQIVGRANWFALTHKAAAYSVNFLKQHPSVTSYFKYCWGADEFIFSTILFNSGFCEKIRPNLVYADFYSGQVGHPRVLTLSDFQILKDSDKLYARKMDLNVDGQVFDLLEGLISNDL